MLETRVKPMAPTTRIAEPGAWWLRAAVVILALNGLIVLVSIPILGSTIILWIVLGLGRLVAAVGVVRRLDWARSLGVLLAAVGIAFDLGGLVGALAPADPTTIAIAGVSLGAWIVVLFALLRRWPARLSPTPAR